MAELLTTLTFDHKSGLPEDAVTWSMCVDIVGDPEDWSDLHAAFDQFLNAASLTSPSIPLCRFLSNSLNRDAENVTLRTYDITGKLGLVPSTKPGKFKPVPHGSPIDVHGIVLGAAAGSTVPLPDEVACVATLRANDWQNQPIERTDGTDVGTTTDRPRQRYSGRVYIGSLNTAAAASVNDRPRPSLDFRTTILNAFEDLDNALVAFHAGSLAVWSRQDAAVRRVDSVQVDDAWDTQRRRGVAPTGRTTRVV